MLESQHYFINSAGSMGIAHKAVHTQQPNRTSYILEANTYSSHLYYIFITWPEYMHLC